MQLKQSSEQQLADQLRSQNNKNAMSNLSKEMSNSKGLSRQSHAQITSD